MMERSALRSFYIVPLESKGGKVRLTKNRIFSWINELRNCSHENTSI